MPAHVSYGQTDGQKNDCNDNQVPNCDMVIPALLEVNCTLTWNCVLCICGCLKAKKKLYHEVCVCMFINKIINYRKKSGNNASKYTYMDTWADKLLRYGRTEK